LTNFKTLRLSTPAQNDLSSIAKYTQRQWGADQKRTYLNTLKDKFNTLCVNPSLGVSRDDIDNGLRMFNAGKHLIFYRESSDHLDIVRVLHASMDVTQLKPS